MHCPSLSLVEFDVAPSIGLVSRSRDLHVFHQEMKNIKKDTFIHGDYNENVSFKNVYYDYY